MLNASYRGAFDSLTDEQAGQMIKAVFAYHAGEDVELGGSLSTAWLFVKAGLDEEKEAQEEISRVNSENGRRGGRPRGHREAQTEERRQRTEYPEGFLAFWEAYPLKKDKGAAYEKYKARINDGYTPEELLESAKAYALECVRNHTEPRYIKHAKTFLGPSTPFLDYIGGNQQQGPDGYGEVDLSTLA